MVNTGSRSHHPQFGLAAIRQTSKPPARLPLTFSCGIHALTSTAQRSKGLRSKLLRNWYRYHATLGDSNSKAMALSGDTRTDNLATESARSGKG